MEKAYQKNDPLFIKIDNRVWGLPLSNSSSADESSGEESPLSSLGSTSSLVTHGDLSVNTANTISPAFLDRSQVLGLQDEALAVAGLSCQMNTDTVPKVGCFMNHNMQRVFHVRQADLESVMYHQHLIATNESIACIQPKNITLSYPSCSEKRSTTANGMAPITITTVDNAPSETLTVQEDLDQSQSDQQQQNQEARTNHDLLEPDYIPSYGSESSSKGRSLPPKKNCDKKLILFATRKRLSDKEPSEDTANASAPVETPARKKNKSRVQSTSSTEDSSIESSRPIVKKKQKRTVTSYDSQTSFYLKSVFFEVYSCQNKLTKPQRAQVQKKTGLPSRNITYWFSNHKRRFHQTLAVYRNTVEDSKGSIKNYTDFLEWRRARGLPDQILQAEVKQLAEKSTIQKKPNTF